MGRVSLGLVWISIPVSGAKKLHQNQKPTSLGPETTLSGVLNLSRTSPRLKSLSYSLSNQISSIPLKSPRTQTNCDRFYNSTFSNNDLPCFTSCRPEMGGRSDAPAGSGFQEEERA